MSKKRILLCLGRQSDAAALRRLASHCCGETDDRLVSLKLRREVLADEYAPTAVAIQRRVLTRRLGRRKGPREYEASVKDLQREAQFADLLLIEDTTYSLLVDECAPLASGCFSQLACPVMVVPSGAPPVQQIVLVDDGEPSTYQQIKYLAHLFSGLCSLIPTTLLTLRNPRRHVSSQDEKLWIHYLKLHFAQLAVHRVEERSIHTLSAAVDYTKNALVSCPTNLPLSPLSNVLAPLKQFKLIH